MWVDEKFHNLLVNGEKKHITLFSMDEKPYPFSVWMMNARKKKKRERLCLVRDERRADQELMTLPK
jgi:hypothetical protein